MPGLLDLSQFAGLLGGGDETAAPRGRGLLGDSWDDPRTGATLAAAQGLLSARRPMQGIADGLAAYSGSMQQAKQQAMADQLKKLQLMSAVYQMRQTQRADEQQGAQDAFRKSIPSPQMQAAQAALSGGGGPTNANAARMPAVDPNAAILHGAMQSGLIDPVQYLGAIRKDNTPIKVGAGEALVDQRTLKPLFLNPKEDTTPGDWKLYQLSGAAQRGITFDQWDQARKRAGATNVTVSTEKDYAGKIAGGLAERDLAAIDAAKSAPDAIASSQRIRNILSQQKPITGAGADARLALAKALHVAGITAGGDIVATENLQRELSQATLAAVKSSGLGGGSGFSNADRDFLEKAAAGAISVNADTLARTAELNERVARRNIDAGNAALKRVRGAQGMSTIPMMEPIQQPGGNVTRWEDLR